MIEALDEIEHAGFSVALVVGTSAPLSVTGALSNLALVTLGNVLGGIVPCRVGLLVDIFEKFRLVTTQVDRLKDFSLQPICLNT